tara:strand:+ start:280 stop:804 length:525 start_codon:yes stop_codon:yes gene_type:complete
MKHLVKLFVITFLYFVCTYAFAEQKIAYINMKYILNESNAGKNAQEQLQNTVKKDQKKFLETQKKLKADELDLISKKPELSKEEYKKKSDELRKKVGDFQNSRKVALNNVAKKRTNARTQLLKELDPILESYMAENNISLVIDSTNVVRSTEGTNITKIIVEKLNKKISSLELK